MLHQRPWLCRRFPYLTKPRFFVCSSCIATNDLEIVVSPPFVYLDQTRKTVRKDIAVAGQNCYYKSSGAYTGEVA